jgi:hypothetical protein
MSQNIDNAITRLNYTKGRLSNSIANTQTTLDYSDTLRNEIEMAQQFDNNMSGYMDSYSLASDTRNQTIIDYQNTLQYGGAYLGTNTEFPTVNATGYITELGVFKPYDSEGTVLESTSGLNGCPSSSNIVSNETGVIYPYSQGTTSTNTGNLSFTVGSPMSLNQSCGNEGKSVFVDKLQDNPTVNFLGLYYDNLETPLISFIDNGNESYTFNSCKNAAANYGYTYFSLQGVDPTNSNIQSVKCGLTNDVNNAESSGLADTSPCQPQSDGNTYGGVNCISIYQTSDQDNIGCFKNNESNPQMSVIMENTNYNTCLNTASGQNYAYFALGPNTDNGATCYASNSLSDSTEPGLYPSSAVYRGNTYGASGVNAIYKITSPSYPNQFGQTAYINEDTKSLPYQLNDLTNSNNYSKITNYDTGINQTSLQTIPNSNPQDCATQCSNNSQCFAYTMDNNAQTCNLYPSSAVFMSDTPPSTSDIRNNVDTYLSIPTVNNHSSCNKDVIPIDSVRFQNYVPLGQTMTPNTFCGLQKKINWQNNQVNAFETNMDSMFTSIGNMLNTVDNYYENFSTFEETTSSNAETISSAVSILKSMSFDATNDRNLLISDEMVNVSNIQVVQKNSMLMVWCIVATLFILLAFVLIYKTMSSSSSSEQ